MTRAGGNGRDQAAPVIVQGRLRIRQSSCEIFEQEKLVKPGDPASAPWETLSCFGAAGQFNSMMQSGQDPALVHSMMPAIKKRIQSNAMSGQTITLCRCSRDSEFVRVATAANRGSPASRPVWLPLLEFWPSVVLVGIARAIDFARCANSRFPLPIISLPPAELHQCCCFDSIDRDINLIS
jgi:hypothetical protein